MLYAIPPSETEGIPVPLVCLGMFILATVQSGLLVEVYGVTPAVIAVVTAIYMLLPLGYLIHRRRSLFLWWRRGAYREKVTDPEEEERVSSSASEDTIEENRRAIAKAKRMSRMKRDEWQLV